MYSYTGCASGGSKMSNSLLMGYSKTICRLYYMWNGIHRGQLCTTFDDLVFLVPFQAAWSLRCCTTLMNADGQDSVFSLRGCGRILHRRIVEKNAYNLGLRVGCDGRRFILLPKPASSNILYILLCVVFLPAATMCYLCIEAFYPVRDLVSSDVWN